MNGDGFCGTGLGGRTGSVAGRGAGRKGSVGLTGRVGAGLAGGAIVVIFLKLAAGEILSKSSLRIGLC